MNYEINITYGIKVSRYGILIKNMTLKGKKFGIWIWNCEFQILKYEVGSLYEK